MSFGAPALPGGGGPGGGGSGAEAPRVTIGALLSEGGCRGMGDVVALLPLADLTSLQEVSRGMRSVVRAVARERWGCRPAAARPAAAPGDAAGRALVWAAWADGGSPLHHLAADGQSRAALRMAAGDADVDARTGGTRATPLMLAARSRSLETVRALIDLGADARAADAAGATPLHGAAGAGDARAVAALLGAGADVNARGPRLRTALHEAAARDHGAVVATLLVAPGADANARDADGVTALHLAASRGHLDVVKTILATPGIDIGKPSNKNTRSRR